MSWPEEARELFRRLFFTEQYQRLRTWFLAEFHSFVVIICCSLLLCYLWLSIIISFIGISVITWCEISQGIISWVFFSFLFCRTWLWTARDRDYVNAIDVKSQKAREKRQLSLFVWYLFIFCNTWFRRWRVRKTGSAGALSQPVWFVACTGVSRWARVESLEISNVDRHSFCVRWTESSAREDEKSRVVSGFIVRMNYFMGWFGI